MKFKTCEDYVLSRLEEVEDMLEETKEENKVLTAKLEYAWNTLCELLKSLKGITHLVTGECSPYLSFDIVGKEWDKERFDMLVRELDIDLSILEESEENEDGEN